MKIGLINYGVGNIKSIYNAFKYLGISISIIENPLDLKKFDKIILPGVGSFKYCMERIEKKNFDSEIINYVNSQKFLLGICVGMQMLCKYSSEDGHKNGFNFFDDSVEKFNLNEVKDKEIPHIGFNSVIHNRASKLFKDFEHNPDFYFIHSYRVKSQKKNDSYSYFNYGEKFVSAIEKENIFGVQFHPEKSQLNGIKLFYNFARA